jgi:hypothetical protein
VIPGSRPEELPGLLLETGLRAPAPPPARREGHFGAHAAAEASMTG